MKRFGHLQMPDLAYQDRVFMESTAAGWRSWPVYDPINRLRRQGVGDTMALFGSARIQPRDPALAARLKKCKAPPVAAAPGMGKAKSPRQNLSWRCRAIAEEAP